MARGEWLVESPGRYRPVSGRARRQPNSPSPKDKRLLPPKLIELEDCGQGCTHSTLSQKSRDYSPACPCGWGFEEFPVLVGEAAPTPARWRGQDVLQKFLNF